MAEARDRTAEAGPSPVRVDVPEHVPPEAVRAFDYHHDPALALDPFGVFDAVRDRRVFFSPAYGGYWVLTRAEDIHEAFRRPELFSSQITGIPPTPRPGRLLPLELDPPEHGEYRQPLAASFSPKAIAGLEPRIRENCIRLVDSLAEAGQCEFLADFAVPFPTTVFVEFLGLPAAEAPRFAAWNHALLHSYDRPADRVRAKEELTSCLEDLVSRRTTGTGPSDLSDGDLFGTLLTATVAGRSVSRSELVDYAFLLFMAGLDTVTAALGFAFAYLAAHPNHREQLVTDPTRIPGAVEELLRSHSIVNPARTVTEDIEFAGVRMREGDRVLLSTVLVNRDPTEFSEPGTVCFNRMPNRHLAFGAGPHRCLGSHLARCELRVALEEFHRRIPDYRIEAGSDVRAHGGGVLGLDHLPLVWSAP